MQKQVRPKANCVLYETMAKFFCVLSAAIFFLSARPVQDDYSLLADVSEIGLTSYLELVWNSHGGNLTPMLLNFLAASTAISSFNFISFSLFSFFTMAFVSIISLFYVKNLSVGETSISFNLKFFLIVGTILGFEGLFSPGLIGAYHFTSASAVHLWPILLTFTGYFLARSNSAHFLTLFLVGFFAGNSNIAESTAILLVLLILYCFPRKFDASISRYKIGSFFSGVFFGTLAIVISPGFWLRATEKTDQGIPSSLTEITSRFMESIFVFGADVCTHPTFYIFFASGVLFAKSTLSFTAKNFKWNFIEVFFWCLFGSLVIGATIAYPAWHQSLGLLFLLPAFSFFSGVRLARFIPGKRFKWLHLFQVFMILVLTITVMRANFLVYDSNREWHRSNSENICALRIDDSAIAFNPEIKYPPLGLGIEGSQSWPWIRTAYVRWLSNLPSANEVICN